MSTTIVDSPPKTKKQIRDANVAQLRKHHEPVFAALGIDPYFDAKAKSIQPPIGKVGFFNSQLKDTRDIYFEITNFNQDIVDTKRTLYKLRHNPHYTTETGTYQLKEDTPAGAQYYVAVEDFEIVTMPAVVDTIVVEDDVLLPGDTRDAVLTARDTACIQLKVAATSKKWLNELIIKSKQ